MILVAASCILILNLVSIMTLFYESEISMQFCCFIEFSQYKIQFLLYFGPLPAEVLVLTMMVFSLLNKDNIYEPVITFKQMF